MFILRLLLLILSIFNMFLITTSSALAARDESDSPFVNTEINNLPYDREWLNILKREKHASFEPDRLRLVYCDDVSGNCLFRSNLPVAGGNFAYNDLIQSMRKAYRARFGFSLPMRFELVDVSLLNWFTDSQALQIEQSFFRLHPEKGKFIHHAIYGAISSPEAYPESIKDWLETLPSMGEINNLQNDLGDMINTVQDKPQMIVVHCRAGHDRTGEVIAAFQMRYLNMSYQETYAKANAVAGRPLNPLNRYGLMWYAYYLRDVLGISTVGDIE